ncbi:MAG: NAD-dependent protein deacylase [Phycisphaerae bacterium]|nr:MAG: NAD-dependent protein deacylase [Phycisphaerae bacterium]
MTPEALKRVAAVLRTAHRVAVLTGAGISAESGLRTFRGGTGATAADLPADMQALWKEFDPMRLATPEAFDADPAMVSRWYDWRRLGCLAAEPNAGHRALARLERELASRSGQLTILTQNVDRLHQKAGSRVVVELHGTILEWRCTMSGRRTTPSPEPMPAYPMPSPFHPRGVLRPDVVWFGEMLPEAALKAAAEAVEACEVFMSIGTSAVVYPAAGYIAAAAARGAMTVEVNPEATPISSAVDVSIRAKAGEALPRLVAGAFDSSGLA